MKIILKPDALAGHNTTATIVHAVPPRPFSCEDEDLLQVIRHMDRVIGVTVGDPSRFLKDVEGIRTISQYTQDS